MNCLPLEIAGIRAFADAGRVLSLPDHAALLLADLHLGKADLFQRAGISLPVGSDAGDLERLSQCVHRHKATRLFLLGDVIHGATSPQAPWRESWRAFRERHPALEIVAISGNHDRHERDALGDSVCVVAAHVLGPLRLQHHPRPRASARGGEGFVVAGHLHPLVLLEDCGRRHRLPCFWLQAGQLVLPAFGATTRGQSFQAGREDRIIAVTPAGLLEIPAAPLFDGRAKTV